MTDVKQITYSLNTGITGKDLKRTTLINGRLLAFMIFSDELLHVTIRMRAKPNIVLYNNVAFQGDAYIPVKVDSQDEHGDIFNYRADNYYLNDELLIQVSGKQNSKLKVLVRYD